MRYFFTILCIAHGCLSNPVAVAESIRQTFRLRGATEPVADNASSKFIAPNEFDNYLHFDVVPKIGRSSPSAVISVGTFRAFNTAAVLRRDALVAIDYSDSVAKFNVALGNLILDSDRTEFLTEILGSQEPVRSREDFLNAIDKALKSSSHPQSEHTAVQDLYSTLPVSPPKGQQMWRSLLVGLRQYAASEKRWEATFFGGEESYNHLRNLIRDGNLRVVRGSLSGETAFVRIAEHLVSRGLQVSEIDVSNALEHIVDFQGMEGMRLFHKNLERLPFSTDSSLLITSSVRMDSGKFLVAEARGEIWYYLRRSLAWFRNQTLGIADVQSLNQRLQLRPRVSIIPMCRDLLKF